MKSYSDLTEEEKLKLSVSIFNALDKEFKEGFQYELKTNSYGWLFVYLNGRISKRYDFNTNQLVHWTTICEGDNKK